MARVKDLPKKLVARAAFNTNLNDFEIFWNSGLGGVFFWNESPEGHKFWRDVDKKYTKKTLSS